MPLHVKYFIILSSQEKNLFILNSFFQQVPIQVSARNCAGHWRYSGEHYLACVVELTDCIWFMLTNVQRCDLYVFSFLLGGKVL